ncbi:hypothetical protein NECHADRAFT_51162 [Paecilomyces variotii No. 5]|uniref:Uncharacterized protein n=1 Tax=Byssochlamys spectabilis (strain No. 5 / NBRC 109023) TaxID=1356009 RepID=V5HT80_BYSSN|nr:hypothetical protein NECHADRAFT_51162 [Paecilomyces variotii No. 5]
MTRKLLSTGTLSSSITCQNTRASLPQSLFHATLDNNVRSEHRPQGCATDELLDPDASILLLGMRGTGKTSLAILASSFTGFRVVDADQHFYQTIGLPRAVYASRYGLGDYREKELSLMRTVLEQNPSRCIIICGPGSAEDTGQEVIMGLKKTHPVIYIMRDPAEVHRYLRIHDAAQISELTDMIGPSYRALSNFEFFNLSEPINPEDQPGVRGTQLQYQPSLVLKHVEDDFLRLIHAIRQQRSRPRLRAQHSLSHLPPEAKLYTYALQIPLNKVADIAVKLRNTDLLVDAIELIIDMDVLLAGRDGFDQHTATFITRNYYTLRRNVKLPVIFHVESSRENRHWSTYFDILFHGLRLIPEYLTLDLSCEHRRAKALMAQKVSTKVIGHFFDREPSYDAWDLPNRLTIVQMAERLGCELARICQYSSLPQDNVRVQHFILRAKTTGVSNIPLIAYNTGRAGRASCFANSLLSPVTHELLRSGPQTGAEQMLSVQDSQKALYASFTLDKLVFGIFGNAVSAAVSPMMHNAAFEFCGMPHVYRTFQSSSLSDLKHLVYDETFGGASISSPFKKEILSVLEYISPEAQAIGAVNTLIPLRTRGLESLVDRNHAGPVAALFGDNTDWIGIYTCIQRHLSPANAVKGRTTALILGAGGMARAAVYAALRLGVQTIFIYNRTAENAQKLVNQFNGRSFLVHSIDLARPSPSISPRRPIMTDDNHTVGPATVHSLLAMDEPWPSGLEPPTIIVSCISGAGDHGQPPPQILLPDPWLRSPTGGVVVELAYNPIETTLFKQIRGLTRKGWIPVHGLQVLPEQGIAQFELFTATSTSDLPRGGVD